MAHNPNPAIEWPECWSPHYTDPSLIGWNSQNFGDKRHRDLTAATQIAYEELTRLENHNGHSGHN